MLKTKIWAGFQRIIELFTQKFVTKLQKIWGWDPGSELRDPGSRKNIFRIPDPGPEVKKAPDPGSGSATMLPAHLDNVLDKGSHGGETNGGKDENHEEKVAKHLNVKKGDYQVTRTTRGWETKSHLFFKDPRSNTKTIPEKVPYTVRSDQYKEQEYTDFILEIHVYITVTVNAGVQMVLERSRRTACHAPDSCCEEGRRQLFSGASTRDWTLPNFYLKEAYLKK